MSRCAECGARYEDAADSCQQRFDALLALDHSRQEPWGSRHGLAFAVYALQHPACYPSASTAQARELLERVYRHGEDCATVTAEFRRRMAGAPKPERGEARGAAPGAVHRTFAVTIADLGDFAADRYAEDLDRWCRATLDA